MPLSLLNETTPEQNALILMERALDLGVFLLLYFNYTLMEQTETVYLCNKSPLILQIITGEGRRLR